MSLRLHTLAWQEDIAAKETFDDIRKMLATIDINRLTPVEALMKLNEIKGMIK